MCTRKGIDNSLMGLLVMNREKVEWTDHQVYNILIEDECRGEGVISSPVNYIKIMHSILKDDGVLLRPKTISETFLRQLGEGGVKALDNYIALPFY